MSLSDTIVAVATPHGRGGVGIIRVSGNAASSIATAILGELPKPRYAQHTSFYDKNKQAIDDGIALFFPNPHSFTGEDILELQGHGGPVVMDMLLHRCVELGARIAEPGEFSQRAFLNDKLDLAQAEAIADLIDSSSVEAARSAVRSLQGDFSNQINTLLQKMIELRMFVEAALDFPDEEIDFLADRKVVDKIEQLEQQLETLRKTAKQGSLLRDGMHLVIAGSPNAGKSSLLNALSGQNTAIVTDIEGTTRDVLRESINLDGMPLHIIDTAGLRESSDPVEKIGIERAWAEIEKADLVLHLIDLQRPLEDQEALIKKLPENLPILKVFNKVDLGGVVEKRPDACYVSAKYSTGIAELRRALKDKMGYQATGESTFIARRRHLMALESAHESVKNAKVQLVDFSAGELLAEELRSAQEFLGQITGAFTADDLLGEIFSSFCIGK